MEPIHPTKFEEEAILEKVFINPKDSVIAFFNDSYAWNITVPKGWLLKRIDGNLPRFLTTSYEDDATDPTGTKRELFKIEQAKEAERWDKLLDQAYLTEKIESDRFL